MYKVLIIHNYFSLPPARHSTSQGSRQESSVLSGIRLIPVGPLRLLLCGPTSRNSPPMPCLPTSSTCWPITSSYRSWSDTAPRLSTCPMYPSRTHRYRSHYSSSNQAWTPLRARTSVYWMQAMPSRCYHAPRLVSASMSRNRSMTISARQRGY